MYDIKYGQNQSIFVTNAEEGIKFSQERMSVKLQAVTTVQFFLLLIFVFVVEEQQADETVIFGTNRFTRMKFLFYDYKKNLGKPTLSSPLPLTLASYFLPFQHSPLHCLPLSESLSEFSSLFLSITFFLISDFFWFLSSQHIFPTSF